jgi:hypothetical protein
MRVVWRVMGMGMTLRVEGDGNGDEGINTARSGPSTSGHCMKSFEDVEVDDNCNDPPPMTQYCPLLAPHIRLPRRSPILGLLSQRLA